MSKKDYRTGAPSGTPTPDITPVAASRDTADELLKKLAEELKRSNTLVPTEFLAEFGEIKSAFVDLAKKVVDFDAKLRSATRPPLEEPVFVWRYVNSAGEEGFVPKSEDGAEAKARALDKDGTIELGYAYLDPKTDKYVGFTVLHTSAGAPIPKS